MQILQKVTAFILVTHALCAINSSPITPSSFFAPFISQDAICTSLSEYNAHIEELKQEMQGATDSAKNIRADIQEIRNK